MLFKLLEVGYQLIQVFLHAFEARVNLGACLFLSLFGRFNKA